MICGLCAMVFAWWGFEFVKGLRTCWWELRALYAPFPVVPDHTRWVSFFRLFSLVFSFLALPDQLELCSGGGGGCWREYKKEIAVIVAHSDAALLLACWLLPPAKGRKIYHYSLFSCVAVQCNPSHLHRALHHTYSPHLSAQTSMYELRLSPRESRHSKASPIWARYHCYSRIPL